MPLVRPILLAIALALGVAAGAEAAPLTQLDLLRQFNLIISGNAEIDSDVGGRTVVGGNLTDGAQFFTQPGAADPSAFRGLTVYGNATERNAISVNNGGGVTVVGTASGSFNLNGGGGRSINGVGAPAPDPLPGFAATFGQPLAALSRDLAQLAANSVFVPDGSRDNVQIRASAGTGLAVFAIEASTLESLKSFRIDLNGRDGAIINVIGNYVGKEDFQNAQAVARDVIWNFVDATKVDLDRQWGGTVLAPGAHVENDAQVHGTLFARSLEAGAAWWSAPFANDIPSFAAAPALVAEVAEPGSLALFALALAGLGWAVAPARGRRPA